MTKKLLIIAFAGLSSTMAFAADLYVRNGGAGGAYSTVSAQLQQLQMETASSFSLK